MDNVSYNFSFPVAIRTGGDFSTTMGFSSVSTWDATVFSPFSAWSPIFLRERVPTTGSVLSTVMFLPTPDGELIVP